MPLDVVWGTVSRSGSQFLLGLTTRLLGSRLQPQSRISGARREGYEERSPSFEELLAQGRPGDYFRQHGIVALKLEDPGRDGLGHEIAAQFPDARWLTSIRPIQAILTSHHNIRKWGHDEDYVLASYRSALELFEKLVDERRLLAVEVERPERFDPQVFAAYLGTRPSQPFLDTVDSWEPTNDLAYQKAKWGEPYEGVPEVPPEIEDLSLRHPWLDDVEERYRALVATSWQQHRRS